MTCENRRILPHTFEFPMDLVMPAFIARLVRRPAMSQPTVRPWEWERLATEKEIHRLWAKADMRRAA
jgi:5-methylcytosine-specific restriction endonuclease McrBC regulatory subunit McrC